MSLTSRIANTCLLFSLIASLGCGSSEDLPPLAPVDGRVTLNGAGVEGAKVLFNPTKGPSSTAVTDASGTFSLSLTGNQVGAVVGTHTVKVEMPMQPDPKAKQGTSPESQGPVFLPPVNYLFLDGIRVDTGTNNVELQLEKAKKQVG
jgi:hypothetical protein